MLDRLFALGLEIGPWATSGEDGSISGLENCFINIGRASVLLFSLAHSFSSDDLDDDCCASVSGGSGGQL
jgi:hypothetical protein